MERDHAVERAMRRLSLAGHPEISWSVVLAVRLRRPLDLAMVRTRVERAFVDAPGLGPLPEVRSVRAADAHGVRREFAQTRFQSGASGVRIALVGAPDAGVLLATHHGLLDGMGLLALLSVILEARVASSARGLGDRTSRRPFLVWSLMRMTEALVAPPSRLAGAGHASTSLVGEELVAQPAPGLTGGTAALVAAAVRGVREWNRDHGAGLSRPVVAVGASRRAGDTVSFDLGSAYLRLRVRAVDETSVARLLSRARPEPALPHGRLLAPAQGLVRLLSRRLGSTILVSNLGRVSAPAEVESIAFFPVAHGFPGVALGAATVAGTTILTLRASRGDFAPQDLDRLLGEIVRELARERRAA